MNKFHVIRRGRIRKRSAGIFKLRIGRLRRSTIPDAGSVLQEHTRQDSFESFNAHYIQKRGGKENGEEREK